MSTESSVHTARIPSATEDGVARPAGSLRPFSRTPVGARAAALAGYSPRRPDEATFVGAITSVSEPN
ncbi:hypothetical protein [Streptomyces sp. JJ38]|uniref:hypothetical protein n=1 Tax=Streptomyces sp. JJ38 TaxID=2738128 RepID=UPI001C57D6EB|nr:hypothetical protein [Streptomyces sp. JJ38]MBW1597616.1 hypothetical protein [Streptomyces sp. JJ38]